jgi:nicotinamidase/pyrazinamidase
MGKTALLIVDMQNDFCPPNGSLAVAEGHDIISGINELRDRVQFDLVVLTQDWHPANHVSFASNNEGSTLFTIHRVPNGDMQMMWPNHCVQESQGAQFHQDLQRKDTDIVVRKGMDSQVDSYSGFFDNDHKVQTEMHNVLQKHNVDTVVLVGLAFDYCVGFSAHDAVGLGYRVYLIKELTRSVAKDSEISMNASLQKANVTFINAADVQDDGSILEKSS